MKREVANRGPQIAKAAAKLAKEVTDDNVVDSRELIKFLSLIVRRTEFQITEGPHDEWGAIRNVCEYLQAKKRYWDAVDRLVVLESMFRVSGKVARQADPGTDNMWQS
jgi:hypothetical protein